MLEKYFRILQNDIVTVSVATLSLSNDKPSNRLMNVWLADKGIYFTSSQDSTIIEELKDNPSVAITGLLNDGKQVLSIRVLGKAIILDRNELIDAFEESAYVDSEILNNDINKDRIGFKISKGKIDILDMVQQNRKKIDFEY